MRLERDERILADPLRLEQQDHVHQQTHGAERGLPPDPQGSERTDELRAKQRQVQVAPFAARRGPSTAEAFKRVGYEVNGLFSFTSFAGESAPRRSSPSSAPLPGLRRGRAVPGRWALDSTRSAVDGVSMRARHASGLALSVSRRVS